MTKDITGVAIGSKVTKLSYIHTVTKKIKMVLSLVKHVQNHAITVHAKMMNPSLSSMTLVTVVHVPG
jgi:hypothetical protein